MKRLVFSALILMSLAIFATNTQAQSLYRDRYERRHAISLGIGPSFMYGDNMGVFNEGQFEWKPAVTLAYSNKIHNRIALQLSLGTQWLQTGGPERTWAVDAWQDSGGVFTFAGQAYYGDFMPIIYLIPYDTHMNRGRFNAYIGSGIGYVYVSREDRFSFDDNAPIVAGSATSLYIPGLIGLTYSIGSVTDLALEFKGMFSFSDELDGNVGYNQFNDHFVQTQLVLRRLLRNSIK
jgi:opacity protein-like surface antigen